ncbi:MAG: glycosyltransferase family 87 protein [Pseudomonadota bacterium]
MKGVFFPMTARFRDQSSTRSTIVDLSAAIAGVAALIALAAPVFSERWMLDFRFFWTAGRVWLDGGLLYGPAYMETGAENFRLFEYPFYYPPTIAPLLAPFSALEPAVAARVFLACNTMLYAGGLFVVAHSLTRELERARQGKPSVGEFKRLSGLCAPAVALGFTVFFHPALASAIYGQPALALGGLCALFAAALAHHKFALAGVLLGILLVKPQFSIPILLYCLITPEFRRAGIVAIAIAGLLTIAGIAGPSPADAVLGFIKNMSSYSGEKWNDSALSAGGGFILQVVNLKVSVLTSLLGGGLAAFLVARRAKPTKFRTLNAVGIIVTAAIIASPNHSYDYVWLIVTIPAFALGRTNALLLAGGILLAGQAAPLAFAIYPSSADAAQSVIAATHTLALLMILIGQITFDPLTGIRDRLHPVKVRR